MTRDLQRGPQHDADHGEADEGGDGSGVALEVACQAPEAAEPGKGGNHRGLGSPGEKAVADALRGELFYRPVTNLPPPSGQ